MHRELQTRWLDLWDRLSAQGDGSILFDHLCAQYSEPHRRYHTLDHLGHCFRQFDVLRRLASRPEAIEWALWFHHVVYDPHGDMNEKQSAHIAESAGRSAGLSSSFCERAAALIVATTHHQTANDPDTRIILDVDLSILGQKAETFDDYEEQIRAEHDGLDQELFAARRSAILRNLLCRRNIFATELFRKRYEAQARQNLTRALARWQEKGRESEPVETPVEQPDLPFAAQAEGGYNRWQEQRREGMNQLARKLNLPLGHEVEVWLRGNIRLRGTLRLREEMLFVEQDAEPRLQLMVDGVPFTTAEMESCVRRD